MIRGNIALERAERFETPYEISKNKLMEAAQKALDKLERDIPKWENNFALDYSINFKYPQGINNHWECGMHTGLYWLAYEMSGNKKFRNVAEKHMPTYRERFDKKVELNDHDVGFVYIPSCIAAYKITGEEKYRQLALDYYYHAGYSKKGGFILRDWDCEDMVGACRTMMDTLMNAPFLFWAGIESGKQEYIDAALSQNRTTEKYLIRKDGSSYHHYQFDVETHKPLYGLTWQGASNESCWSRGHAWGVYGFPIAYGYSKEEYLINLHRDVTYYMLNKLPEDFIPHWDYIYAGSNEQPRDSSAGAISVCGMREMCRHLSDDEPQKKIFESASAKMLEAIIDNCTGDIGKEYDGLIYHVTHALPQGLGIDECAIYGDYFYLEALMRFINPTWKGYW